MASQLPEDLKKQELAALTDILSKERTENNNNNGASSSNNSNTTPSTPSLNKQQQQPQQVKLLQSDNLWNSILEQSINKVRQKLEPRHMIVLGDRFSGKSSFIARLQHLDLAELREGIALDYAFLDIQAESSKGTDDEPISRLNVWVLDGDVAHRNLLKFSLNPETIAHSLAVIVINIAQPWDLVDSLNRWLKVLQEHLEKNVFPQLPKEYVEQLRKNLTYDFQQYSEPGSVSATPKKKTLGSSTSTSTSNLLSNSTSNLNTSQTTNTTNTTTSFSSFANLPLRTDDQLLPLAEGTLNNNLGIPILVVVTKTDETGKLEKEFSYNDSHFDYIQQYLRRICLQYGAGLVFTSARKDVNSDVSLAYIENKLFGFELKHKMQLERDTLFVPSGADSLNKINLDFQTQNLTKDPNESFDVVISVPKIVQARRQQKDVPLKEALLTAEDDQEFLLKRKDELGNKEIREVADTQPQNTPATQSSSNSSPTPGQTTTTTAAPGGDNQLLQDFFNSLINKPGGTASVAKSTDATKQPSKDDIIDKLRKLGKKDG